MMSFRAVALLLVVAAVISGELTMNAGRFGNNVERICSEVSGKVVEVLFTMVKVEQF